MTTKTKPARERAPKPPNALELVPHATIPPERAGESALPAGHFLARVRDGRGLDSVIPGDLLEVRRQRRVAPRSLAVVEIGVDAEVVRAAARVAREGSNVRLSYADGVSQVFPSASVATLGRVVRLYRVVAPITPAD